VSRRYVNAAQGIYGDVYVVYCSSRPGGIIGHQPLVCYPGNGWIHDETVRSQIVSRSGRTIDCLVHRFHKAAPSYQQTVVLNFYVLNGQITLSEGDFSGLMGRRPNLSGDLARYVAQVQISSAFEYSARATASELVDTILALLPDREGHVHAADSGGEFTQAGEATAKQSTMVGGPPSLKEALSVETVRSPNSHPAGAGMPAADLACTIPRPSERGAVASLPERRRKYSMRLPMSLRGWETRLLAARHQRFTDADAIATVSGPRHFVGPTGSLGVSNGWRPTNADVHR